MPSFGVNTSLDRRPRGVGGSFLSSFPSQRPSPRAHPSLVSVSPPLLLLRLSAPSWWCPRTAIRARSMSCAVERGRSRPFLGSKGREEVKAREGRWYPVLPSLSDQTTTTTTTHLHSNTSISLRRRCFSHTDLLPPTLLLQQQLQRPFHQARPPLLLRPRRHRSSSPLLLPSTSLLLRSGAPPSATRCIPPIPTLLSSRTRSSRQKESTPSIPPISLQVRCPPRSPPAQSQPSQ